MDEKSISRNRPFINERKMISMGIFGTLFRSRDAPQNRTAGSGYTFYFGGTTSGKAVTERSAMQMTAVYSCVRILAEAVAGLPLNLYRYTEDGGKEKAIDHPLYLLLHDEPNPEMSSFVFRETLMTHLLLWGNAYAQVIRNGKGEVVALYPLMPNKMTVDRDDRGQLYYTYQRSNDEAVRSKDQTVTLRPSDVLHIPGLGFDGLVGYSPIAMAKNAIGMAIACEEYGAKFFANGASPSGVLEHPGTLKDPQRVRESWHSTFGGSANANKVAVLEEGMKYTPIGISPEQAQFLETRKFQVNEIARIFRVPPHMVGDLEKSSFSNIEQQSLEFVKYTLDPWVTRWEQSIQRSLLTQDEKSRYFVKFNVEGLLRGDYQSRMNGYAIGRQNGWMSANDIRELENLDRIPAEEGGDLYLINGNMTKLKDAGIFAASSTGKDEEDEEVLELEGQDGDQSGDDGTDAGTDAVPQRHHRRR
jgi:HK97 family phage portal protein